MAHIFDEIPVTYTKEHISSSDLCVAVVAVEGVGGLVYHANTTTQRVHTQSHIYPDMRV